MPALVLVFFVADCALIVPYVVAWKMGGLYWKIGALVDVGGKANLVSWYASMQLFLIALLLGVFAHRQLGEKRRGAWLLLLLPLVFAAMSFEEIADVHDWLAYKAAVLFPLGFFARDTLYYRDIALVGAPLLAVLLALLALGLRPYLRGRPATTWKYLVGVAAFALCGADLLSGPRATPHVVRLSLEELGELIGMTLILWATCDLLVSQHLWPPAPVPESLPSVAATR